MLKRLPFLCAALLALAACSHDNGNSPAPTPPVTAPATTSTAPTPAASTPAPVSASTASAPATAGTAGAEASAPANGPGSGHAVRRQRQMGRGQELLRASSRPSPPVTTGKIEVTEVFSYACPSCNQFHSTGRPAGRQPAGRRRDGLPAGLVPAATRTGRCSSARIYTAQALGVADKTNDAMFDAVWKSGELSTYDLKGSGLKPQAAWPTHRRHRQVLRQVRRRPEGVRGRGQFLHRSIPR